MPRAETTVGTSRALSCGSVRVPEDKIEAYYDALSAFWHPVARSADLVESPLGVRLLDRRLVLARLEGEAVAFEDLCRHLGAALSIGDVVEGCHLRCRYHGWSYDRTGRCVDIPARRGRPIPREAKVRRFHTREAYGIVWVCLAGEPQHDIPPFPEYRDEEFHKGPLRTYGPWRASVPRVVMAALDDTHFPWVHPGILGDPSQPDPPEHEVWREDGRLLSTYTMLQPDNDTVASGEDRPALEKVTYTNHLTPTSIRLVKESAAGTYVIWQASSPISWDETLVFSYQARTFDRGADRDPDYERLQDEIQEQDRPVVESQRPWLLPPLSSRMMLYIRPADLPLISYQKWLEELGIPQQL